MGGGLFGTPVYLNPKCLLFSLAIIIVYFLPHPKTVAHNIVMIFLLGTSAYISLSLYDVLYDCNDRFKPTILGWLSKPLKPKEYTDLYNDLPIKEQKTIRIFDITELGILVITFLYPFLYPFVFERKPR